MKTKLILLFLSVLPISFFCQIKGKYNAIRPGDVIVKQQVEYVDAGEQGNNNTWDFSRLKTLNNSYELAYSTPPLLNDNLYIMGYDSIAKKMVKEGELVLGTEHNYVLLSVKG